MTAKPETLRLGFLTAIEVPEKGFVGGLLITNHYGRPLEFQCTVPVKPNATQEILYGSALEPFVLGELIGGTLVDKAGVKPQIVLTDREQILELRNHVDRPVALVLSDDSKRPAAADPHELATTRIGGRILQFHAAHADDRDAVEQNAKQIPASADLGEPFERVREALQEVLRNGALR
jgi:hypothetical protein